MEYSEPSFDDIKYALENELQRDAEFNEFYDEMANRTKALQPTVIEALQNSSFDLTELNLVLQHLPDDEDAESVVGRLYGLSNHELAEYGLNSFGKMEAMLQARIVTLLTGAMLVKEDNPGFNARKDVESSIHAMANLTPDEISQLLQATENLFNEEGLMYSDPESFTRVQTEIERNERLDTFSYLTREYKPRMRELYDAIIDDGHIPANHDETDSLFSKVAAYLNSSRAYGEDYPLHKFSLNEIRESGKKLGLSDHELLALLLALSTVYEDYEDEES